MKKKGNRINGKMRIANIEETVHQLSWLLTKVTRCLAVASKAAIPSPLPPLYLLFT